MRPSVLRAALAATCAYPAALLGLHALDDVDDGLVMLQAQLPEDAPSARNASYAEGGGPHPRAGGEPFDEPGPHPWRDGGDRVSASQRRKMIEEYCRSPQRIAKAEAKFREFGRAYLADYSAGRPRSLSGAAPGDVSLDFEVEVDVFPKPAGYPLLLRSGVGMKDIEPWNPSEWFSDVEIEGGLNWHANESRDPVQQHTSRLEIQSVTMRPTTAYTSRFAIDLAKYLSQLKPKAKLPGPHSQIFVEDEFRGAKAHALRWPRALTQFTVGLPLDRVPALLARTRDLNVSTLLNQTMTFCLSGEMNCDAEYAAVVVLASHVLLKAYDPACQGRCKYPKRCQFPWMVRTHFGDLASHLRKRLGDEAVQRLPEDVMRVWGGDVDAPLWPYGTIDYLKFPQMAELTGFVASRQPEACIANRAPLARWLPTDSKLLKLFAHDMMQDVDRFDKIMKNRKCAVYGQDASEAYRLTGREWLQEILKGRDLMSDHDSPISKASDSHLVFKSMGQWRMQPQEGSRIYLECRLPWRCVAKAWTGRSDNVISDIGRLGKVMERFEEEGRHMTRPFSVLD